MTAPVADEVRTDFAAAARRAEPVLRDEVFSDKLVEEAEIALLAACLADGPAAQRVLTETRGAFSSPLRERIREAMDRAAGEGRVDEILLHDELRSRLEPEPRDAALGLVALLGEQQERVDLKHVGTYISRVLEAAHKRESERLRERVRSAKLGREQDAAITALVRHQDHDPATRAGEPSFEFVGGDELLTMTLAPIEWLVGNGLVRRRGITTLTAAAKRAKTLSIIGLAAKLVRKAVFPADDELRWFGAPVQVGGPVVLVGGEGGLELYKERLQKIEPHLGDDLGRVRILARRPFPRLDVPSERRAVFAEARRVGAVAVLIDPLSRFWSIEDENAAGPMTQLFGALRAEAEDSNVALVVAHHDARQGEGGAEGPTGGRGSSVLANEPDCLIRLRPHDADDPHASRAYFAGRWGTPDPCVVRVNEQTLHVEYVAPLGKHKGEPKGAAVPRITDLALFEAVQSAGGWVARGVLEQRVGLAERQLRARLDHLVDEGQIERRGGNGRPVEYRVTPSDPGSPADASDRRGGGRA